MGVQENGWTLLNGHGAKEVASCEEQPSSLAEPGDDQAHAEEASADEALDQDRCCPGCCSSYPSKRCCLTLHCTLLYILLWASSTRFAPMGVACVTKRPVAAYMRCTYESHVLHDTMCFCKLLHLPSNCRTPVHLQGGELCRAHF